MLIIRLSRQAREYISISSAPVDGMTLNMKEGSIADLSIFTDDGYAYTEILLFLAATFHSSVTFPDLTTETISYLSTVGQI